MSVKTKEIKSKLKEILAMDSKNGNDRLARFKEALDFIEEEFIEYLNGREKSDEGNIVPAWKEHLWYIAQDKLRDQGRPVFAEHLFYYFKDYEEKRVGRCCWEYIHKESGCTVKVDLVDIIKYGRPCIWRDFGLRVKLVVELKSRL